MKKEKKSKLDVRKRPLKLSKSTIRKLATVTPEDLKAVAGGRVGQSQFGCGG